MTVASVYNIIQLHIIYSIVMSIGWMELQHVSSHVNIRGHPHGIFRKNFWRFGVSLFGEIQCPMYPIVSLCVENIFLVKHLIFWLIGDHLHVRKKKQTDPAAPGCSLDQCLLETLLQRGGPPFERVKFGWGLVTMAQAWNMDESSGNIMITSGYNLENI